MKTILTLGALLIACASCACERTYTLTNPTADAQSDLPVAIPVEAWVRSAVVKIDGREIPSQVDDLNGDGVMDELSFVVDFPWPTIEKRHGRATVAGNNTLEAHVTFSKQEPDPDHYPRRVDAYMALKTPDGSEMRTEICAPEDNMYNRVLPHGPSFESELVAYRLYFDRKQTVDLYGKRTPGLELNRTLFYPTDEQLAEGAGDDVIRVFSSVGVGTLRGYDAQNQRTVMMHPMRERCARIVANGPVRVVVEMVVRGWEYGGRTIDMTSRYTLWAGRRDCFVENIIVGGEGLSFATGIMKMADHTVEGDTGRGYLAVWGTDWPVNDTVKFPKQTVGMAIAIDPERVGGFIQNAEDYLFLMQPDERGRIDYRITFAARKEEFGYSTEQDFFRYANDWSSGSMPVLRPE